MKTNGGYIVEYTLMDFGEEKLLLLLLSYLLLALVYLLLKFLWSEQL